MPTMEQIEAKLSLSSIADKFGLTRAFRETEGEMTYKKPLVLSKLLVGSEPGTVEERGYSAEEASKVIEEYVSNNDARIFWKTPYSDTLYLTLFLTLNIDEQIAVTVEFVQDNRYLNNGVIILSINDYNYGIKVNENRESIQNFLKEVLELIQQEDENITGILGRYNYQNIGTFFVVGKIKE